MIGATAAREVALATLRAVRQGQFADRAFAAAAAPLDGRDRAWARELAYGALRLRGRLDAVLAPHSRRPLEGLDADVLDILRLGAYQLLEMTGVPAYAAVSQSVELARRAGGRGSGGYVNGVLRALRRAGPAPRPAASADPAEDLTHWGSHPRWLIDRWLTQFGPAATRALVDANNRIPGVYLRPLTGDGSDYDGERPREDGRGRDGTDARAALRQAGIAFDEVPGAPFALRLCNGDQLLAALAATPLIVQDPAAGWVVEYAAIPEDAVLLDLAAAPGGKALALAARPARRAYTVAADRSWARLEQLGRNVRRLNPLLRAAGLGIVAGDGRAPPFRPVGAVLLDAPCTGTGTLRRHPDGRWRVRPEDLFALARLQRELLAAAASLVRPGGVLVYATCSLEPEENDVQVEAFLKQHPAFALRPPTADVPHVDGRGFLRVLPQATPFDGAFAARMVRR